MTTQKASSYLGFFHYVDVENATSETHVASPQASLLPNYGRNRVRVHIAKN